MSGQIFAARAPEGGGSVFHDMTPESYPFVAVFLDIETKEEVWRAVVRESGATSVPSMNHRERPTTTRVYFYSGRIFDMGSDGVPHIEDVRSDFLKLAMVRSFIDRALEEAS